MTYVPDLTKAIRNVLEARNAAESDRLSLHVSDLAVSIDTADGGACPRALWLRLHQAERREPHAGEMLMWAAGYRLQDAALGWLREGLPAGWRIGAIEKELTLAGVVGRCDAVLESIDGSTVVVDFKTIRGRGFKFLEGPKTTHILQVQSYMMALDAGAGILLYMDREGSNFMRQFTVRRDDIRVRAAVNEAERIAGLNEPPPVLEAVKKRGKPTLPWQCSWCVLYQVSCDGADVTGIDKALAEIGKT